MEHERKTNNECSKENYNDIEQEGIKAYKKTAQAVSVTYDQAVRYAREHYGTSTLVALGMGVGMGLFLGGNYKRSRLAHFTKPVIESMNDLKRNFLR